MPTDRSYILQFSFTRKKVTFDRSGNRAKAIANGEVFIYDKLLEPHLRTVGVSGFLPEAAAIRHLPLYLGSVSVAVLPVWTGHEPAASLLRGCV